ncbi:MAG: hypothetical protein JO232_00210 [Verrucomicrobia bacterium]|nr:hypothetical protein [Verrucomicrobiota bacterium]
MKRILFGTLAAAVSFSPFALTSAAAQSTQQWAVDRETLLHSKLAGMKAGLGLRPDQHLVPKTKVCATTFSSGR